MIMIVYPLTYKKHAPVISLSQRKHFRRRIDFVSNAIKSCTRNKKKNKKKKVSAPRTSVRK